MIVYNRPRWSGKTFEIVDQVKWCSIFDILPVCIITCNKQMVNHIFRDMSDRGFTNNDFLDIHLCAAPYLGNNYSIASSSDKIKIKEFTLKIQTLKPKRIYIDEYQFIHTYIIKYLDLIFNDSMFAYGTPLVDIP